MKVMMLDTVEDSNEFDPKETSLDKMASYTISQHGIMKTQVVDGKRQPVLVKIRRVDRLRKDETYDLPKRQAEALIQLRYAQKGAAK